MVGIKEKLQPMWKPPQEEIDIENPTPLMNPVHLGCTQREAEVDHQTFQSKPKFFKRIAATRVPEDTQTKEQVPSRKVTA